MRIDNSFICVLLNYEKTLDPGLRRDDVLNATCLASHHRMMGR